MDDRGRDRDTENAVPEPVWIGGPTRVPASIAPKLFEGVPDEIKKLVEDLIKDFVVQALGGLTQQYHRLINTTVRQNVQAFSNENLATLAGFVNAEVNRRAGG